MLLLQAIFDEVTNYHANIKLWILVIRIRDLDGKCYGLNSHVSKEKDKVSELGDTGGFICFIIELLIYMNWKYYLWL